MGHMAASQRAPGSRCVCPVGPGAWTCAPGPPWAPLPAVGAQTTPRGPSRPEQGNSRSVPHASPAPDTCCWDGATGVPLRPNEGPGEPLAGTSLTEVTHSLPEAWTLGPGTPGSAHQRHQGHGDHCAGRRVGAACGVSATEGAPRPLLPRRAVRGGDGVQIMAP